jgi:hypothetical protein
MAPMRIAALLIALLLPVVVPAKAWQGIEPGKSTSDDVTTKFNEPTSRVKRGSRTVLAYKGDQALPGTREAQFHLRPDGVVEEITVFLTSPLDGESIEGTYGKPTSKTFTDSFQKVWLYPVKGVTVYFDKDGGVLAISFSAGSASRPPDKAGAGKAPPAGEKAPATKAPPETPPPDDEAEPAAK